MQSGQLPTASELERELAPELASELERELAPELASELERELAPQAAETLVPEAAQQRSAQANGNKKGSQKGQRVKSAHRGGEGGRGRRTGERREGGTWVSCAETNNVTWRECAHVWRGCS